MFSQALEQELLAWQNATLYDFHNSHYKCVYVVQKYDSEGNYDRAVFSTKEVAIEYAKNSYSEMMESYKKAFHNYAKNKSTLEHISKTEGYYVIMFILDAVIDNHKTVFDTANLLDNLYNE
jgi:hypothetical protein